MNVPRKSILKVNDENSRIWIRIWIRIHSKMSWIRTTETRNNQGFYRMIQDIVLQRKDDWKIALLDVYFWKKFLNRMARC